MKTAYPGDIVWIIGASSGIGAALATELAARGASLALSARREQALQTLKRSLEGRHEVFALDVADAEAVTGTTRAIGAHFGRIDRVIFLAAAYTPMRLDALDIAGTRQIVEVNLLGALHIVHSVLPVFRDQAWGQIALCGSVAGYVGLPGGQPYSATKAAVMNLTESLKNECSDNIDVKLISPGFVRTELTDKNDFEMPMIISSHKASGYIADGLLTSRFEVHFPKRFTYLLKLLQLLPYRLTLGIIGKLLP